VRASTIREAAAVPSGDGYRRALASAGRDPAFLVCRHLRARLSHAIVALYHACWQELAGLAGAGLPPPAIAVAAFGPTQAIGPNLHSGNAGSSQRSLKTGFGTQVVSVVPGSDLYPVPQVRIALLGSGLRQCFQSTRQEKSVSRSSLNHFPG
jgi:hypothetical protein